MLEPKLLRANKKACQQGEGGELTGHSGIFLYRCTGVMTYMNRTLAKKVGAASWY